MEKYTNRKEDKRSKLSKLVHDVRSIYFIITLLGAGIAWASNVYHSKYLQVDEYHASELKKETRHLNNEVADLKIEKNYAVKERDKRRIQELIIRKKLQVQNLKGF